MGMPTSVKKTKCNRCDHWKEDIYYTLQDGPLCTDCLREEYPEFFSKQGESTDIRRVKGMESLGEFLKRERKVRGIALEHIAHESKVGIAYLRWLEEDRLDKLPAPVYAKGYLHTYCDTLGLGKEEAFSRYSRQVFSSKPKEEDTPKRVFLTKQKILIGTLAVPIFIAILIMV